MSNLSNIVLLVTETNIINEYNKQQKAKEGALREQPRGVGFSFVSYNHTSSLQECNDQFQKPRWNSHVTEFRYKDVVVLPIKGFAEIHQAG